MYDGQKEYLRLIGIESPEIRKTDKARAAAQKKGLDLQAFIALGKKAKEYLKTLVQPGMHLQIEFDVKKRDNHHRLLGYAYLPDGSMINQTLIHTESKPTYPNFRHKEKL
ncbi:MAG: thermonuclease family protein [Candidatus Anammoxibacter sp.]